jgi:hypothetical protein
VLRSARVDQRSTARTSPRPDALGAGAPATAAPDWYSTSGTWSASPRRADKPTCAVSTAPSWWSITGDRTPSVTSTSGRRAQVVAIPTFHWP